MQGPGHPNAPPDLLVKWPAPPSRKKQGGNDTGPPYPWRSTTAKREKGGGPGRPLGRKNRNRRDELLRRFGLTAEQVDGTNQVTPLLRKMGMLPSQLIEVLRTDDSPESRKIVAGWDQLTPANQRLIRLEGLALAVDLTTRRLWELYCGADLAQGLAHREAKK